MPLRLFLTPLVGLLLCQNNKHEKVLQVNICAPKRKQLCSKILIFSDTKNHNCLLLAFSFYVIVATFRIEYFELWCSKNQLKDYQVNLCIYVRTR